MLCLILYEAGPSNSS